MTPVRRGDGRGDGGLFDFGQGADVSPRELRANPRTVPCRNPTCRALITEPCVSRLRGRVVRLRGYHRCREEDAEDLAGGTAVVPEQFHPTTTEE